MLTGQPGTVRAGPPQLPLMCLSSHGVVDKGLAAFCTTADRIPAFEGVAANIVRVCRRLLHGHCAQMRTLQQ